MTAAPRLERIAGPDGIAHANRPGSVWTLCGIRATGERFGWPHTQRCPECVAEAEALLRLHRDAAKGLPIG